MFFFVIATKLCLKQHTEATHTHTRWGLEVEYTSGFREEEEYTLTAKAGRVLGFG